MVNNSCRNRDNQSSTTGSRELSPRSLPARNKEGSRSEEPISVLIVEDHALTRKSLERGLRQLGFAVCAAASGREAIMIYALNRCEIDLVLCDLNMPGMNGLDVLCAARQINPNVRFCFMKGDTRAATTEELLRSGALRVFAKPLSPLSGISQELRSVASQHVSLDVTAGPESAPPVEGGVPKVGFANSTDSDGVLANEAALRHSMSNAYRRPR